MSPLCVPSWLSLRGPRGPRDERANSFAMFIVMLPMLIGAFGLGVDVSRNAYIRISLQNSLDAATVAGAGVTQINPNGEVVIMPGEALTTVEKLYAINRADGPGLKCTGSGATVAETDAPRCWRQWRPADITQNEVTYSVRERSTNMFLKMVGVVYQDYRLTSTARVRQSAQ